MATTDPPNELLYASAAILNLGVAHEVVFEPSLPILVLLPTCAKDPDSLVDESKPLYRIALTSRYPVETQRAGLHFLSALCETSKLSKPLFLSLFNAVLPSINAHDADAAKSSDPLLLDKVPLSDFPLFLKVWLSLAVALVQTSTVAVSLVAPLSSSLPAPPPLLPQSQHGHGIAWSAEQDSCLCHSHGLHPAPPSHPLTIPLPAACPVEASAQRSRTTG